MSGVTLPVSLLTEIGRLTADNHILRVECEALVAGRDDLALRLTEAEADHDRITAERDELLHLADQAPDNDTEAS